MLMISFKDSGESGDEVQDYVRTTKNIVTCTMVVYTIVYTRY